METLNVENFLVFCWLRYVRVYAIANPSVVFHASYSGVKDFGNISSPLCTLAILWPVACKILRRCPGGMPPSDALNARRVAKCSDFGPVEGYISWTVAYRISGAGSGMAGRAAAIPIWNLVWRRHTNPRCRYFTRCNTDKLVIPLLLSFCFFTNYFY